MFNRIYYCGDPLLALPSLYNRPKYEIINEIRSLGIPCSNNTFDTWVNHDIKEYELYTICDHFHLTIFYFLPLYGFENQKVKYEKYKGEWTPIVTHYEQIRAGIIGKYGKRKNVVDQHIMAGSRLDSLKPCKENQHRGLMMSQICEYINSSDICIFNVIQDLNIPIRYDQTMDRYICELPGYEEYFFSCRDKMDPVVYDLYYNLFHAIRYKHELEEEQKVNADLKEKVVDMRSRNFEMMKHKKQKKHKKLKK